MKQRLLHIHPNDNVLVALDNLKNGETITFNDDDYLLAEDIPAKHKLFMHDMNVGSEIIMYGVLVGKVQCNVKKGSRMTVENTAHAADDYAFRNYSYQWTPPDVSRFGNRTFNNPKLT